MPSFISCVYNTYIHGRLFPVYFAQVLDVVSKFVRVFLGFISSGWRRRFMSLTTTRAHIYFAKNAQKFSYVVFRVIFGLTSVAMTDALSELEKRYWRVHLADAWAPRQNQTRDSLSSPCKCLVLCRTARRNASPYSALHWDLDPTFARIIWNRYSQNLSGRLRSFFPYHFSAVVSMSQYWLPLCDVLLVCVNKSAFVVSIFS